MLSVHCSPRPLQAPPKLLRLGFKTNCQGRGILRESPHGILEISQTWAFILALAPAKCVTRSVSLNFFIRKNRDSERCCGDEMGKCMHKYLAQRKHPIMSLKC